MRSLLAVFSALCLLLLRVLPAHAQICSEQLYLDDFLIQSEEIHWIEIENTTESVLVLDGQILVNSNDDEFALSGLLLPGDNKIIHLPKSFIEETAPTEPEYQLGAVELNELFANPVTDESTSEFIELYNNESFPVALDGWTVADKAKSFELDGLEIAANGYLALYRSTTGIALNNTSETIELVNPFGVVVDTVSYETTTEGSSLNRDTIWYEANPSPGQNNNEPIIEEEPEETSQPEAPKDDEVQTHHGASQLQLDENLDKIKLSELLPNPEGSDDAEWVELYNPTEFVIKLNGLTLTDGSGEYLFDEEVIQPDGYYVLEREESGIALNNSGDVISLFIDDRELDQFEYTDSTEGLSWGLINNSWSEQVPSPGVNNIISKPTEDASIEETIEETTPATTASNQPEYASWAEAKHNEVVKISGVITATNNILKAKTIFVSTAMGVIEVYSSKNNFAEHTSGQQVTLIGKKSITSTGERLLLQHEDNMQLAGIIRQAPFVLTTKDQAESLQTGMMVQLSGRLIEQNKKDLILELGDDEWNISLEHLPQKELLPLSSQVIIIGALRTTDSEPEIIPFMSEHLIVSEQSEPSREPEVQVISTDTQQPINEPILVGGGIAGVGSYLMREKIVAFVKRLIS